MSKAVYATNWEWKVLKRGRVMHLFSPWIKYDDETLYRKRCDNNAIVAEFKDTGGLSKCQKCSAYINMNEG